VLLADADAATAAVMVLIQLLLNCCLLPLLYKGIAICLIPYWPRA